MNNSGTEGSEAIQQPQQGLGQFYQYISSGLTMGVSTSGVRSGPAASTNHQQDPSHLYLALIPPHPPRPGRPRWPQGPSWCPLVARLGWE